MRCVEVEVVVVVERPVLSMVDGYLLLFLTIKNPFLTFRIRRK
jgi:hypothetical protein